MIGYGLAGDAYHITAPAEDGDGGFRAMKAALKDAGIDPADIDYINAHGTSTPLGDEIELGAVERLLGKAAGEATMSSTKSATGHLLGAAGAIEAAFTLPGDPRPDRAADHQPGQPVGRDGASTSCRTRPSRWRSMSALSNSFGFGGTNASVIFKKVRVSRRAAHRRRAVAARTPAGRSCAGGALATARPASSALVAPGRCWSYARPGPGRRAVGEDDHGGPARAASGVCRDRRQP